MSVFLVFLSTYGLLLSGRMAESVKRTLIRHPGVNSFFIRQLIGLAIALTLSSFTVIVNGTNYLAAGKLSTHPLPVDWLGIAADSTWLKTATELSITIVIVTLIFLFFFLRKNRPLPKIRTEIALWSIFFALTNSLSEELIFRFSLLNLIEGQVSYNISIIMSALFFGIPHYKGMPNGVIGVCMATFLGFVLAKSVLETDGILIAWMVHFVLDIPIIFTLLWTFKVSEQPNNNGHFLNQIH